ncbi:MAG: 50S ribosomal protein L25 [Patescibacteria group bacterium]
MELKIAERKILGKRVKSLRKQGLIPAEIFGHGIPNKHITVPAKDFGKIFKEAGEHTIINLAAEGEKKIPALVSEVQYNTLKGEILAVDFHQVRMDEKIQTKVPVEFKGEAPAVKNGFVVLNVLNEIEIEALPTKIPHRIEVDLNSLETPGQSIRLTDLKIPADVKILTPADAVIVTVSEIKEEIVKETAPPTTEAETPPTTEETQEEKAAE